MAEFAHGAEGPASDDILSKFLQEVKSPVEVKVPPSKERRSTFTFHIANWDPSRVRNPASILKSMVTNALGHHEDLLFVDSVNRGQTLKVVASSDRALAMLRPEIEKLIRKTATPCASCFITGTSGLDAGQLSTILEAYGDVESV